MACYVLEILKLQVWKEWAPFLSNCADIDLHINLQSNAHVSVVACVSLLSEASDACFCTKMCPHSTGFYVSLRECVRFCIFK
jgi:hypothetical protein